MDADEFYIQEQVENAKKIILEKGYEMTACMMRTLSKAPTIEYHIDEVNGVPFINGINLPLRLAAPYPKTITGSVRFTLCPCR